MLRLCIKCLSERYCFLFLPLVAPLSPSLSPTVTVCQLYSQCEIAKGENDSASSTRVK